MQLSEEVRGYWDMRSAGFSDAVIDELGTHGGEIARRVIAKTGIYPGSRVLDVGCGPGLLSIVLAREGADVTGIDASGRMIAEARENAGRFGLDIDLRVMDAQKMDFPDGTFDAVVSRSVLWCLEKPGQAYSEMVRVLRPGGRGYVSDGNYYRRLFDGRYAFWPEPGCVGNHERFNRGNVDFGIIERLAEGLPLSRLDRPQWDFGTLCQMNVSDICADIVRRPNSAGEPMIASFSVSFTKGGDGSICSQQRCPNRPKRTAPRRWSRITALTS